MATSVRPPRNGNLPTELTSFVGRKKEISAVRKLLESSRLVTLTGVGGAGKTRVAMRAAQTLERSHPDGVWFVDLATVDDPALLAPTIYSALGLDDRVSGTPAMALAEYLSDRKLLLILDNCDHLTAACAMLTDSLLRRAPDLRVLATSRQTLGTAGEHVLRVPPLSMPEDPAALSPAGAGAYEGIALFLDRAAAVGRGFQLSEENLRAVAAVCQRLDGIPLAIELAAARLSAMSIHDLLDRLDDRYTVLVGKPGGAPRHRTLRELISWSWDLCSQQEQEVWARASTFPASFDIYAAEAVCSSPSVEPSSMLDLVAALVDKSILTVVEDLGRVRYRLLPTLRQFGYERLNERGQAEEVRETHRTLFLSRAAGAAAEFFGDRQAAVMVQLRSDQHDLRAALEICFDQRSNVDLGLDLVSDLWFFWIGTGQTSEARRWWRRGLVADADAPQELTVPQIRALVMWAYVCVQQEDMKSARPLIAKASEALDTSTSPVVASWSTQVEGMIALCEGALPQAQETLSRALSAHRQHGDQDGTVDTMFFLAAAQLMDGDLLAAENTYMEALTLCESTGRLWNCCYMQWGLALVACARSDYSQALDRVRQSLTIARKLDEVWATAYGLEVAAWCLEATGSHKTAALLVGGATALWQRLGWRGSGLPVSYGIRSLEQLHDDCVTRLSGNLGTKDLRAVFDEGAAMPVSDLVGLALGEPHGDGTGPRAQSTTSPLTKREREVADLVAEGLSNKSIAARLFISQRTAEVHVLNALSKLGFNSRAQLAAWVVERRSGGARGL